MLHINLAARILNPAPVAAPAAPVSVAYLLGASDADAGCFCLAELYYVQRTAVLNYVAGYEAVAGETMLSKQTKVLYGVMS